MMKISLRKGVTTMDRELLESMRDELLQEISDPRSLHPSRDHIHEQLASINRLLLDPEPSMVGHMDPQQKQAQERMAALAKSHPAIK